MHGTWYLKKESRLQPDYPIDMHFHNFRGMHISIYQIGYYVLFVRITD